MNMNMRGCMAFALACLALAACTPGERPQGTVSPQLNSGITSNNGGGSRALNNNNNMGVTTPVR